MTASPATSPGTSLASVASTTPAGTINHTARGLVRWARKSSSEVEPIAPSLTSALTASADTSCTTHWWPPWIRRRTMLAPMRPRPIIPICMYPPRGRIAARSTRCRRAELLEDRPEDRPLGGRGRHVVLEDPQPQVDLAGAAEQGRVGDAVAARGDDL